MPTKNNYASTSAPDSMPFPIDFDATTIQQNIKNYLIPYFHTICKFLVYHYRLHTPDWLQTRGDVIHEFIRSHQLLSDYLLSFAFWYSLPLLWFLVWSVGGFLITAIIGVTMFVITNGFIIGSASIVVTPFFIFAIMASFMTTFAISVGRAAMSATNFFVRRSNNNGWLGGKIKFSPSINNNKLFVHVSYAI
ncbi:5625_t:CDS:2 [Ambispora leptoticha]|uniref:5625_t:CDS:1 n=1 Tax=Ambispora leptoticha TaxID=144679 RepID=A0A9N9F0P3_9GLOM|nr:5625_t:CDS:2 [Ambispora leptoticha]